MTASPPGPTADAANPERNNLAITPTSEGSKKSRLTFRTCVSLWIEFPKTREPQNLYIRPTREGKFIDSASSQSDLLTEHFGINLNIILRYFVFGVTNAEARVHPH